VIQTSALTALIPGRRTDVKRYLRVGEAEQKYSPKRSAWRKWILSGVLGNAVIRCGRLVLLDSVILDERLARTGQLLVTKPSARDE
jgi:hypothetical protein